MTEIKTFTEEKILNIYYEYTQGFKGQYKHKEEKEDIKNNQVTN